MAPPSERDQTGRFYRDVVGAVLIALSMYDMTNVYGDLDFWFMARSRMLLGVGLPLIFVPIIAASYDGLPPGKTDQASALLNAARNTGGSIGISLVANVLWERSNSIRTCSSARQSRRACNIRTRCIR